MSQAATPTCRWVRPDETRSEPRWGHADGMQIGIHPLPGPRGLLRVYAPYLDHPPRRVVNFIAIEPITEDPPRRGYSELEPSSLDPGTQGKRFWTSDAPETITDPGQPSVPARGVVETVNGVETLTVWVGVERFDDGADVHVRLRFRADRPREVELSGFANAGSAPLRSLVFSATMGNWARLRTLELAERIATPRELWPGYSGTGFTEHAHFGLHEIRREGAAAVISAIGDEEDPWSATYAVDTADHWRFEGMRARQTWRVDDPSPDLEALVNARWSYWASTSAIPGGPAFENFEIVEPFRQGATFRFVIDPLP